MPWGPTLSTCKTLRPEGIKFTMNAIPAPQRTVPARHFYRADHVGSFLRPKYLLDAHRQAQQGQITGAQLREIQDKAIAQVVRMQEDVGLQSITDGELRRDYFHLDFLSQLDGVQTQLPSIVTGTDGREHLSPPSIKVVDRVRHGKDIQLADFRYLASVTRRTPKVTIPSPTMLHFRGGRGGISEEAYPDLETFYQDVADAYAAELRSLFNAGCTFVQFDDTNLAYLCDEKMRAAARERGDDPDELPHRYAAFINRLLDQKPQGMTTAVHLCRGNFKSTWAAQGGYEPVAEALLARMNFDSYFLEYDDARSGDFQPLRFLPKGKLVVLGLISTKMGALESVDDIRRRIDEAARFAPLEQLALSPQCGFASTLHGNDIAMEQQTEKLGRVVEVARRVWGEV